MPNMSLNHTQVSLLTTEVNIADLIEIKYIKI